MKRSDLEAYFKVFLNTIASETRALGTKQHVIDNVTLISNVLYTLYFNNICTMLEAVLATILKCVLHKTMETFLILSRCF